MAPELARCPADCVAYTPAGKHSLLQLGICGTKPSPLATMCSALPKTRCPADPGPACAAASGISYDRSPLPHNPCSTAVPLASQVTSGPWVWCCLCCSAAATCRLATAGCAGPPSQTCRDRKKAWTSCRSGWRCGRGPGWREHACVIVQGWHSTLQRLGGSAACGALVAQRRPLSRPPPQTPPSAFPLPAPSSTSPLCLHIPPSPSVGALGLQGGSHQPAAHQPGEGQGAAGRRTGEHCMLRGLRPATTHARCSGVRACVPCALASPASPFVVTVSLMPAYIACLTGEPPN